SLLGGGLGRGGGGLAHHQRVGGVYHARRPVVALDPLGEQIQRGAGERRLVRRDGGQRRGRERGVRGVVVTDHGDVPGHPQAAPAQRGEHPDGEVVIGAEHDVPVRVYYEQC